MKRRASVAALLGIILLPALAAAQAIEGSLGAGAGTSCFAQALGAQPFVESKTGPAPFTPNGSLSGSGQGSCQCERQGDPGVSAKSEATVSYSATVATAGTDAFGNVLVSSITMTIIGTAKAEAQGGPQGVGSNAVSGAQVLTGFRVLPGTMVTVEVAPTGSFASLTLRGGGFLPSNLAGGFAGPATDQFGSVEIAFTGGAGANTSPPGPANFNGSVTATITFGAKPPQGACCFGPGECSDEELQSTCSGTFLGDQSLCSAGGCSGVPTPTPTATPPSTVFTWTNGSGGDYDVATNWTPPEVPGSVAGRDDTAIFDLTGTYAVSLAADRNIERLVVSHGRVELDNTPAVTLAIAASSPSEPSITIENDGRFDLITGILRSVHTVIGHVPPQNPASPPIAEMLVSDSGSAWATTGNLAVGAAGKGRLFIANGALVVSGSGTIGGSFGGEVSVGGRLTSWQSGNLSVGFGEGVARLNIEAGATVETGVADVGRTFDALAETTVTGIDASTGSSSSWTTDVLTVGGAQGTGKLTILDGGFVITSTLTIAEGADSTGIVTVSGQNQNGTVPQSRLVVDSLTLGQGGDLALMDVKDGGGVIVSPGNLGIALGGVGDLTITGVDSLVSVGGDLLCGNSGSITLNGGRLEVDGSAFIGVEALVSGNGQLVMTNGGAVILVGTLEVPPGSPATPLRRAALSPGPAAPFQVVGNFVQGATGRLAIDVAGTAPGLFGALAITGDATLGGTLDVRFVDGFLPAAGDSVAFLTVDGAEAGSFDRVRFRGVDEDFAFATSLANGVHTLVVTEDARACAPAGCEVCDNCRDDNGDGLVDRADPDCSAAADGAGVGSGGDAAARKALGKCAAAMATVGDKLAALVAKRLQSCAAAVLACEQTKPGDAACLAKARTTCAKATTPLAPAGKDRSKARLAIAKACGATTTGTPPAVPLATIAAATGLGFDAEVARCAALATPLASVDDVVACIDRATVCRASALFATRVPRAAELLTRGNAVAALLACLPVGAEHAGAFGDPKTVGKPLVKCQSAIAAAGAKLAARLGKSYGACAVAMRGCVQSAAPAECLAKATSTCAKATRGRARVAGAADAKLLAALTKACGGVTPAALLAENGLGFEAVAARCAALDVPALDGPAALATCLSRAHACAVPTLLEAATPRLREHLGRAGVVLD